MLRAIIISSIMLAHSAYAKPPMEVGIASWYGEEFRGKPTAIGRLYDETEYTAAHRTLEMNSVVKVTNLENGKSVVVVIMDRGPYTSQKRVIDVSKRAASDLEILKKGLVKVRIEYLENHTHELTKLYGKRKWGRGPFERLERLNKSLRSKTEVVNFELEKK